MHKHYTLNIFIIIVAISAALTTPLDVAKTRIMLSNVTAGKDEIKISVMLNKVYHDHGFKGYYNKYVFPLSIFFYFTNNN